MQVNNLPSGLQQLQRVNSVDAAQKQQGNLRVDGNVVGPISNANEKTQQQQERFDVSEKALEVVAKSYQAEQQNNQPDVLPSYDQPSQRNQTAVSTYQNVNNLSQREDIKSVFGVDLFA